MDVNKHELVNMSTRFTSYCLSCLCTSRALNILDCDSRLYNITFREVNSIFPITFIGLDLL